MVVDILMAHFFGEVLRTHKICLDARALRRLSTACQHIVETLGSSDVATIELDLLFGDTDFHRRITREDLTALIRVHTVHERKSEGDQRLVIVGDLHGDPLALLYSLQLSGAVEGMDWESVATQLRGGRRCDDMFQQLRWVENAQTTIVFLGDIVDNKRFGDALPVGSEELILDTLYRLKQTGRCSDITWVLGNHDVENTMINAPGFCQQYSNPHYCDKATGGFTPTRQQWMRDWIGKMDAAPVVIIDRIAFCHGTLTKSFLDRYDPELSVPGLLQAIKQDYRQSVTDGERVPRIRLTGNGSNEVLPDWCRRGCNNCAETTIDTQAMHRVDCYAIFGAHIVMDDRIMRRTIDGKWSRLEPGFAPADIEDMSMYFTDLGMSRAFRDPEDSHRVFGCVILTKGKRQIRQIQGKYMCAHSPAYKTPPS